MSKVEIGRFFNSSPVIDSDVLHETAKTVSRGLELGHYGRIGKRKRRVVDTVSQTLLLNQQLLEIPMPIIGIGSGNYFNIEGERVDYLALTRWNGSDPFPLVLFARPYIQAWVNPSKYGEDLDYRQSRIEETTAHECFHIRQWIVSPDQLRKDTKILEGDRAGWPNTQSERDARSFAEQYYLTRFARDFAKRQKTLHGSWLQERSAEQSGVAAEITK